VGLTPEGTRILMVAVNDDAPSNDDRSSQGVWLLATPTLRGPRKYVVECRNPTLDGVFTHLIEQVVDDLGGVEVEGWPAVVRRRLDEWRKLLMPLATGRMSRSEQIGLWGELTVLSRRLDAGARDALESWVASGGAAGPDFRWDGAALEVKTTTAQEGFDFHVHGLGQLDLDAVDGRLLVAGVRAIQEPSGVTIPELVEGLLQRVNAHNFLSSLGGRDYRHDPSDDEGWVRLRLSSLTLWEVEETTPRLHPGLLPSEWRSAVSEVSYTLSAAVFGAPLTDNDGLWL